MNALDDLFAPYPAMLTTREVAELLATTQIQVSKNLRAGHLPGYQVNGRWLILADELKACLAAARNSAPR